MIIKRKGLLMSQEMSTFAPDNHTERACEASSSAFFPALGTVHRLLAATAFRAVATPQSGPLSGRGRDLHLWRLRGK